MSSWNEQAAADWAAHGVFHGRITDEEWAAGGVWLFGDRLPDGHPGKTPTFCYKSWCARPKEKYLPGNYTPKNRVKDGQWEFVQVLDGCLECCVDENGVLKRFPLGRGECVDLRPELVRYWQLEGANSFANGIAFFRQLPTPPIQPGAGEGYEFRLWDSSQVVQRIGTGPLNLSSWSVKFFEVLSYLYGVIYCEVHTLSGLVKDYCLCSRDYLFLHPGVKLTLLRSLGYAPGIVVYLQ